MQNNCYSIYHFFKAIIEKEKGFLTIKKLEDAPFCDEMLSCVSKGKFPDLAIRLNKRQDVFKQYIIRYVSKT